MKIKALAVAVLAAGVTLFAQDPAPAAASEAAPAAPAAEQAQPAAVAPETAQDVNKSVATHVHTSAKSLVEDDIAAYCRELGITLGKVTPKDAIYLKGVERVSARSTSPDFVRARSVAYEKAYQKAVASYVMDKFGAEMVEQFNTYFADNSQNRLQPVAGDAKSAAQRIEEKTQQLTEAKLDEGLRKLGVTPEGSLAQKRKLLENALVRNSTRRAIGSSAGLLPVQTFEGWTEGGQYAVGVVIRGGAETETVAACLRDKTRPALCRPEAGLAVENALPSDEDLVSQFGVRLFFDENGVPALLSFGQWGSAYTGTDEDMAEDALEHALVQAEAVANEQLTLFINSTISVKETSEKGEVKSSDAVFDANGVPSEQLTQDFVDRIAKEATTRGSDTMRGRSTVVKKIVVHPSSGQKIAVCVRLWSFGQYDAMTRVIEKKAAERPVEVAPASTLGTPGSAGRSRGRSYDF